MKKKYLSPLINVYSFTLESVFASGSPIKTNITGGPGYGGEITGSVTGDAKSTTWEDE